MSQVVSELVRISCVIYTAVMRQVNLQLLRITEAEANCEQEEQVPAH